MSGILTRFLPSVESFFLVNASKINDDGDAISQRIKNQTEDTINLKKTESSLIGPHTLTRTDSVTGAKIIDEEREALKLLVGGERLLAFVNQHKVLLNALLRANPSLLEKR